MQQIAQLLTVAILVSGATMSFAQKGTLKGRVTDSDTKDPVPFVSVYVSDKSAGTTTDFDGSYTLQLNAGSYEVVFSSLEYGKTSRSVTMAAGETLTLDISIEKADIKMETILVKTDKYAKPIEDVISSMDVIKPNIIENKGSTSVMQALEQAPGLTIVDNEPQLRAGSGYSFGAGSRVMVLVDDLPILSGDAGRPSWGYIPVENIEQVEVVKGASSVLYGSAALNGVINVRTAYPKQEPVTKINLITGVYDKPHREEAKWWEENFPFWSSINFFHSRRIKSKVSEQSNFAFVIGGNLLAENSYLGPEPVDYEVFDSSVTVWSSQLRDRTINQDKFDHLVDSILDVQSRVLNKPAFTNRARLTFNTYYKVPRKKGLQMGINGTVMYGRSTSSLLWLNNTDGLLRPFPGAFTTTLQTTFNFDPYISYLDQRGNKYSLNTRVFYQDNNNDNNQANKNTVTYGEFRYMKNFRKINDFTLSAGIMGNYTTGQSQLYAGSNLDSLIAAGEQAKSEATNVAMYAQLDKKFWERLNVTLGGRWEYFNIGGRELEGLTDNQPVFRAGANYQIQKATYIRVSFGQGFRFPTIAERYIETTVGGVPIVANPLLKAETAWNAEGGIKQSIKVGKFLGYLDVAGFVQQYRDYVEFIAAQWKQSDFGTPGLSLIERFGLAFKSVNTNKTRVSGLEVSLLGQGSFTDEFGINMLAGYTWARPVALEPDKTFGQDINGSNLNYINTSTDTTNYILKYRYENLAKLDFELNYKGLSVGTSFRYYSFMQNVDAIFYSDAIQLLGIDAKGYREENDTPEYIVDFRISYEIVRHSKIAFIINNLLNREYALRPLVMDPPRSFALQYSLTL